MGLAILFWLGTSIMTICELQTKDKEIKQLRAEVVNVQMQDVQK